MKKYEYSLSETDCNTISIALSLYLDDLSKASFPDENLVRIGELVECFGVNKEFYKEHE